MDKQVRPCTPSLLLRPQNTAKVPVLTPATRPPP